MSELDGTRTISIPSLAFNYVNNRLESIGCQGELYYRDRGTHAPHAGTRWHELFGTPERAAEYFAMQCFGSDGSLCYYCPFDDCDENLRNMGTYPSVHDMMLEWLKGDA